MLRTGSAFAVMLALALAASPARADFALGGFFGNPTGIDLKIGVGNRSGLDIVGGWYGARDVGDGYYGHLTYLVTPFVGHGSSVIVPLRLGIGGAVFGGGNDVYVGARFPLEVGIRFRSAPLEIYGELALMLVFVHPHGELVDGQGGIGLRFYF